MIFSRNTDLVLTSINVTVLKSQYLFVVRIMSLMEIIVKLIAMVFRLNLMQLVLIISSLVIILLIQHVLVLILKIQFVDQIRRPMAIHASQDVLKLKYYSKADVFNISYYYDFIKKYI